MIPLNTFGPLSTKGHFSMCPFLAKNTPKTPILVGFFFRKKEVHFSQFSGPSFGFTQNPSYKNPFLPLSQW